MVGVDEVGRGCLAGPLVVVAARAKGALPTSIKDSKLLSRTQREALHAELIKLCEFGEGWVHAKEVDKLGLAAALRLGVQRAVFQLSLNPDEAVTIDGPINYLPRRFTRVQAVISADSLVPIVSAASIYAKVVRDRYMIELAVKYPEYLFDKNVGYGTPGHFQAINNFGPVRSVHRFSFAPINRLSLL